MTQPEGLPQAIARAWFENLPPIPQAFALQDLPDRDRIIVIAGVITMTVDRSEAVRMIRSGQVRIAPADPSQQRARCPLAVMDGTTGFPVLIEATRRDPPGKDRP